MNLSRLQASLDVAARVLAPSVEAFDTPLGPPGSLADAWGLLLGAPALTEAGLAPAGDEQREADDDRVRFVTTPSSARPRGVGFGDIVGVKVGILAENVSRVLPAATTPTTVPTVTRMPRMHGFPPIYAGVTVMRIGCGMPNGSCG